MTIELWLTFLVASTVMLLIPGPTIITVVAYASSHGKKATLPLIAAVSLGDITVITLSVIGLGSLLAISSTAFTVVKVIGGLYLLILGARMIWSANRPVFNATDDGLDQPANLFFNTWLVTALNPKGIIFFGAFLPQFIQTNNPIAPQLAILTITFVCLAALNTLGYALLASKASQLFSSIPAKRRFNTSGGVAMAAAGVWALTSERVS
ncbi:MAG: LysE family translocator [Arenicella sp.]|nr:LysE family translocator [Arenicella sp.]